MKTSNLVSRKTFSYETTPVKTSPFIIWKTIPPWAFSPIQARPDMKKRPVFGLSWKRCANYCEWREKRLATEAEWERAAAGLDGRKYPWGNSLPVETPKTKTKNNQNLINLITATQQKT